MWVVPLACMAVAPENNHYTPARDGNGRPLRGRVAFREGVAMLNRVGFGVR